MKKSPIAAAGLAAATLAFGWGTAHAALAQSNDAQAAPRLIEHPTQITRPGAYVLRRNISSEGPGAAITIAASNVSLDLNGFSVLGPGGKLGIGVLVDGVTNVRVHNGHISAFGFGVQVVGSGDVRLEGLQIRGEDAGGPPPGEVGVMIVNSRGVLVANNVVTGTFLGVFVRGGGSGGNRIAGNTLTGGQHGQLGICYNPDGLGTPAAPSGDLVYNNLVSRFNIGIQTSPATAGNIFRENAVAYFEQAINEVVAGSNVFEGNATTALVP